MTGLEKMLMLCAAIQIGVAILNLFLIRMLGWKEDLARMSLLPRQVFQVHVLFISATLLIFGVLTLRFHEVLAAGSNPVAAWLAGGIAIFWGMRTLIQVVYYSPSHWRGKVRQTFAHIGLLLAYGLLTLCYGVAAI